MSSFDEGTSLEFRNIPDVSEVYVAGSDGNIYSKFNGVLKKLCPSQGNKGKGYFQVSVKDLKGKRKTSQVHTLICKAFHGVKPKNNMQVSHKDGDMFNNKPENLAWSLPRDNLELKKIHGTDDCGVNNTRAKLCKDKLFVMRWLLTNSKLSQVEIANVLGVDRLTVTKVFNGHRYNKTEVIVVSTTII